MTTLLWLLVGEASLPQTFLECLLTTAALSKETPHKKNLTRNRTRDSYREKWGYIIQDDCNAPWELMLMQLQLHPFTPEDDIQDVIAFPKPSENKPSEIKQAAIRRYITCSTIKNPHHTRRRQANHDTSPPLVPTF